MIVLVRGRPRRRLVLMDDVLPRVLPSEAEMQGSENPVAQENHTHQEEGHQPTPERPDEVRSAEDKTPHRTHSTDRTGAWWTTNNSLRLVSTLQVGFWYRYLLAG